mgnify:CR=1 FL=1
MEGQYDIWSGGGSYEVGTVCTDSWLMIDVRYGHNPARHSACNGVVGNFMHNLGRSHWKVLKHIFRYLVGTQDYDITFAPDELMSLIGYHDLD